MGHLVYVGYLNHIMYKLIMYSMAYSIKNSTINGIIKYDNDAGYLEN